jgi:chromobox protein 1
MMQWKGQRAFLDANARTSENAQEKLDEYHAEKGVPPPPEEAAGKKTKGKRSASTAFKDSSTVAAGGEKRGRKSEGVNGTSSKSELPAGSWETHIMNVTSIIEEDEVKGKGGKTLIALVEWTDGRKTQHKMETLRRKCPQKLLNYYEQHL